MRSFAILSVALAVLSGCAHTMETQESSATVVSAPPATKEVIAVDEQAPQEEAPRARPRLTQTVTLGQSNGQAEYSAPPPAPGQPGQGGNTQNVTVNNNVIVNQPPAVYGGYPAYGYGYGARGYSRGVGVRSDGFGRAG